MAVAQQKVYEEACCGIAAGGYAALNNSFVISWVIDVVFASLCYATFCVLLCFYFVLSLVLDLNFR